MDSNFKKIIQDEHKRIMSTSIKVSDKRRLCKQYENEVIPYLEFIISHLKGCNLIRFMEIGVCYGGNFVLTGNLLSSLGVEVNGLALDLPNVDLWGGHNINPNDTIKAFEPKFDWKVILGDSHKKENLQKAKDYWQDELIDLLFIDGDHSYKGAKQDFDMYTSLVKKDGFIVLHDTVRYNKWKHVEVWKLWNELKEKYEHYEFSKNKNYGIGVLIK